jgi:archaemetzincin
MSLLLAACGGTVGVRDTSAPTYPSEASIRAAMEAVRPLHARLAPPAPNEWLASFPEPRQTFDDYLKQSPVTAHGERRVLYVQPIGPFRPAEWRVVVLTAEFLRRYFNLPVRTLDELSADLVPATSRRARPDLGTEQLEAGYVTMQILLPRLPRDAAACIALTSADLWPGNDWNYVFGQASLQDRVGVWSMFRYGDPGAGDEAFRLCLLRTLKVASHETGHMFTIGHCVNYRCVMGGSISLAETDGQPLEACPECMAKLCWATGADPETRFRRLADFCRVHGLDAEARAYERSLEALAPGGLRDDPESAAARAEIEARTAERAAAWRRRDSDAFLANATADFTMRLGNGIELDRAGVEAMLGSGWRRMPREDSSDFTVDDVDVDGDAARAIVRHDHERGRSVYRETWVRTPDGWRLGRSEALE